MSDLVDLRNGSHPLTSRQFETLLTRYPSRLFVAPELASDYVFLNVTTPPFDDVRVRRALNLATDRRRVVDLNGGPAFAEPSCQVTPPSLPGYHAQCPYTIAPTAAGTWSGPDLARARRLIAASGTKGMRVTMWSDTDKPQFGRYFAGLLERLGYRSKLRLLPVGFDYLGTVADPRTRAQIGMYGWLADYPVPSSFIKFTFSCGAPNVSQFCDSRLDRAVAQATRAGSADAWATAERRLVDLAPAVPLDTYRAVLFASSRAGNVQQHPMEGPLLERVWVK
jgi:peptide/nickel transport system substrate-binding protein